MKIEAEQKRNLGGLLKWAITVTDWYNAKIEQRIKLMQNK